MSRQWRLAAAALRGVIHGTRLPEGATRFVPLAGIVVGLAGAAVYWAAAQVWPASIAVVLSLLAMVAISPRDSLRGTDIYGWLLLLVKYNALMALSTAASPFVLPEFLPLGLIMIAGQAASRALAVSVALSALAGVTAGPRITTTDLTIALLLGGAPGVLLGIPGLIGLAAALALRLAQGLFAAATSTAELGRRQILIQQLTENAFYLGALATWKYV